MASLEDVEKLSKETNCIKSFIAKGIGLASFIQARCLDLGRGVSKDSEMAKKFYSRVKILFYLVFILSFKFLILKNKKIKSYQYDADVCQLFQNFTTYQKV